MSKGMLQNCPNKTVIEMTSVNKLKDALIRTELIVPAIPDTDDKVPSWGMEKCGCILHMKVSKRIRYLIECLSKLKVLGCSVSQKQEPRFKLIQVISEII